MPRYTLLSTDFEIGAPTEAGTIPVTMFVRRQTNFKRSEETIIKLFPPQFDLSTLKVGQQIKLS